MEQNQSESMLKCCDVERGGRGVKWQRHDNDINLLIRTLDKVP